MVILPRTQFVCCYLRILCGYLLVVVIQDLRAIENVDERSMVFFHNINPGARVQVKWRGEIEAGTIRYTGSLVAKDGDWVGIELDNRGSVNNGASTLLEN